MTDFEDKARTRRGAILIAVIFVVALAIWGGMQFLPQADAAQQTVQVVDGDGEEHLLSLSEDATYTFDTSLGTNTIVIKDGEVHMESADCPGQDCVDQGAIDGSNEMIVCMPHKLIVSIVS